MNLFLPSDRRPLHFVGIWGAGMSALALIALRRGIPVTGSDTDISGAGDLVAGTHGKTTTTVMATEAVLAAGFEVTGIAGGRVAAWGGNARMGGDDLYVVEADEYDQAFLTLRPTIAVVNNVESDHLECYG